MVFSEGIADEVEKYKPAELNTLLERFYAVLKNIQGDGFIARETLENQRL